MPVPAWIARVNKRVFNPLEMRKGKRPVLTHVGRSSGAIHRTPLDAHRVEGGFVFFIMYGAATCDWARNVIAAGGATVTVDGRDHRLENPRIISRDEAFAQLAEGTKPPPGFLRVTEFLRMDG